MLRRLLARAANMRSVELRHAALLASHALLLMVTYYSLKTVREPLLLAGGSAELKSYAQGATAAVLLLLVPCFDWLIRRTNTALLMERVTVVCVATLAAFCALGRAGVDVGFAYYVWIGAFGVTILAQFWSHATRCYDSESGARCLPFIMAGAAIGGLLGPLVAAWLFPRIGSWRLLELGIVLLAATGPLTAAIRRAREGHRAAASHAVPQTAIHGFKLLLENRRLRLIALLVVIINCVNSTGEYLLTSFVLHDADLKVAADPSLDRGAIVAAFYAQYFFNVNVLTVLLQIVFVRQSLLAVGVRGTIVFGPLIAALGYGLVAFVPMFGALRAVKLLENSVDYSLMNTVRQILYLDVPGMAQHQGRSAIDTFCYRLGDLLQAGIVGVGAGLLRLAPVHFAWVNAGLALIWLIVATRIGQSQPRLRARRFAFAGQSVAIGACCAAFVFVALWSPAKASAAERGPANESHLFGADEPLDLALEIEAAEVCRSEKGCGAVRASLVYRDARGLAVRVPATVRIRGQWRAARGHCSVPPLFVAIEAPAVADTVFAGHALLPLTTHCRESRLYEQYVLKEYLAYRIYESLSAASLRVRLARVTYRFADGGQELTRYAFFTENFSTLAARHAAEVSTPPPNPERIAAHDIATLELFEYLIGNTDWSSVRNHNIVHLERYDGGSTPVPYDFDFAGIVGASYATPAPELPITSVRTRLFRGFCRPELDWGPVFARFIEQRSTIDELIATTPGLTAKSRAALLAYIGEFYATIGSPTRVADEIVGACRVGR